MILHVKGDIYVVTSRAHAEELFPRLGEKWLDKVEAATRAHGTIVVVAETEYLAQILYTKNGVQMASGEEHAIVALDAREHFLRALAQELAR